MCDHKMTLKAGFLKSYSSKCSSYGKYRCKRCKGMFCGKHIYKTGHCFKCRNEKNDGAY